MPDPPFHEGNKRAYGRCHVLPSRVHDAQIEFMRLPVFEQAGEVTVLKIERNQKDRHERDPHARQRHFSQRQTIIGLEVPVHLDIFHRIASVE